MKSMMSNNPPSLTTPHWEANLVGEWFRGGRGKVHKASFTTPLCAVLQMMPLLQLRALPLTVPLIVSFDVIAPTQSPCPLQCPCRIVERAPTYVLKGNVQFRPENYFKTAEKTPKGQMVRCSRMYPPPPCACVKLVRFVLFFGSSFFFSAGLSQVLAPKSSSRYMGPPCKDCAMTSDATSGVSELRLPVRSASSPTRHWSTGHSVLFWPLSRLSVILTSESAICAF